MKSEVQRDFARLGSDGMPRLIQITTWYPAESAAGRKMTYGQYVDLAESEQRPATDSALVAGRERFAAFLRSTGMASDQIGAMTSRKMRAVNNASPRPGKFPLVVIVQGNGQSAANQSPLAEYLASNGYVAATIPSYTRISSPPASDNDVAPGAEEQADDIEFVVAAVRRRSNVDAKALGLVAHSLGARGALLYGMRNPNTRALVSLDGGIGTATARDGMEKSPSFASRMLSAHVLHFYETLDSFMTPDFTLLREIGTSSLEVARVSGMHHHHFTDLGSLVETVPGLSKATHASKETGPSYRMMMQVTRAFLDTYLKGDEDAFASARRSASRSGRNRPAFHFETLRRANL